MSKKKPPTVMIVALITMCSSASLCMLASTYPGISGEANRSDKKAQRYRKIKGAPM
ncbi:MAG: hypothetical protein J6S10_03315 [Clostridia bacterium]|nr:hypothetical protein [Clostridia bacterium]